MISKSAVRRASKRVADGDLSTSNIRAIEEYRSTHDELLVRTSEDVNTLLGSSGISFLVAGRPKRTSAIVRKLVRERNAGGHMNVIYMADLVGLRVLVRDMRDQDEVVSRLQGYYADAARSRDYRVRETGYRAVHLIVRIESRTIEVQVRTLAQHLWAVESESFSRTVKEGGGSKDVRAYLDTDLSPRCKATDEDLTVDDDGVGHLFAHRAPFSRFLPNLRTLFEQATRGFLKPRADTTYIVVFDSRLSILTRIEPFVDERDRAMREYGRLGSRLDQERFAMVVLNSRTPQAISVTHPNFFPRVKFGRFDEELPTP